jgi:hypothetical protein
VTDADGKVHFSRYIQAGIRGERCIFISRSAPIRKPWRDGYVSQLYFEDSFIDRVHEHPAYTAAEKTARLSRTKMKKTVYFEWRKAAHILQPAKTDPGYVGSFRMSDLKWRMGSPGLPLNQL